MSKNINFNLTDFPSYVYADQHGLQEGDWTYAIKRFFIPGFASSEDRKVSEYFIRHFKELLNTEASIDQPAARKMISFAETHIQRHQDARLERYTLAALRRLGEHRPTQKCCEHNQALFSRWTKAGFDEEAFWAHPDLVDFVFQAHLHRHITHPDYKHTVRMKNCLVKREGRITAAKEAVLLVSGVATPWSKISRQVRVDSESRLYSMENGKKIRWTYLENGLTPLSDDHVEHPMPFKKLSVAPADNQIQIVTTHAHAEDWNFLDRILHGSRHSFIRIIPGQGFSARHPGIGLQEQNIYSFGWGTVWRDFNIFSPLSTLKGKWYCPDDWEFVKQDQCVTTLDVSDDKMIKLIEIIRRRSKEDLPFHFITANCCGTSADVLHEAEILDLCTKNHMARLGYELIIPKGIRNVLDHIETFFLWITPKFIQIGIGAFAGFIHSVLFAPLFSLLGAWRTTISFEDEEGSPKVKAANRVKALFSNVYDLFRPSKMEFDLTRNIYHWQKQQPNTVFEKRN